jgi:hypothetical protein
MTALGLIGQRENLEYGSGEDFAFEGPDGDDEPLYYDDDQTDLDNRTDDDLFSSMESTFRLYSQGGMEDVAVEMVHRFRENRRGEFENERLNQELSEDYRTKQVLKEFTTTFGTKIKQSKGKLDFGLIPIDASPNYDDKFSGKGITVHGTQGMDIFLDKYEYNPRTGNFAVELSYTIYDDFGLSRSDVLNLSKLAPKDGVRAWWELQHRKGYRPFTTKITGRIALEGHIK